ncbi:hypothetical protein [uncultured Desulfobulbus sp.]|uniref:hypothetical protein n=1 Tax=uncultured Desulfobulbus sp. TaxID=239745 RepID=UPI0029C80A04|nr:hypothetical protein [uncultured Desulfobulbus sp.]
MNTAVDIGFELKMSSKKDYIENFYQKFDAVFDVIDLPNLSLFEIIEKIKSLTFSVDSYLAQIIIQTKLDYIHCCLIDFSTIKSEEKQYVEQRLV